VEVSGVYSVTFPSGIVGRMSEMLIFVAGALPELVTFTLYCTALPRGILVWNVVLVTVRIGAGALFKHCTVTGAVDGLGEGALVEVTLAVLFIFTEVLYVQGSDVLPTLKAMVAVRCCEVRMVPSEHTMFDPC
jgi:hypothetical protein